MRPFPFATTIALFISVAATAAAVLYPHADHAWTLVLWAMAGLAAVIFVVGLCLHLRKPKAVPLDPQPSPPPIPGAKTQTIDTGGGGSLSGDSNTGNVVVGQVNIHNHRPDLSCLPTFSDVYGLNRSKAPFEITVQQAMHWRLERLGRTPTINDPFDVLEELRLAAGQDRIAIWGRPRGGIAPVFGQHPIPQRIPASFWHHQQFETVTYVTSTDARAVEDASTQWDGQGPLPVSGPQKYYDLRVSQDAVEELWNAAASPAPEKDFELKFDTEPAYESGTRDATGKELATGFVYLMKVKNVSNRSLHRCQVTFGLPNDERYPVSPSFDLRRGEDRTVAIFRAYNDAEKRPYMPFHTEDGKIKSGAFGWVLGGGKYEVNVFSDSAPPATLALYIGSRAENWAVKVL